MDTPTRNLTLYMRYELPIRREVKKETVNLYTFQMPLLSILVVYYVFLLL